MKTNPTDKVTGLILAVVFSSFIVTGCSSTSSRIAEASGSARNPRLTRAHVGNLVAMKHNGQVIYVNEAAVAAHLQAGDTLAVNDDGKTVYTDERELQDYLAR